MDFRAISTQQSLFIAWMAHTHTQSVFGRFQTMYNNVATFVGPNEQFDVLFWIFVDIRYHCRVSFLSLIQL